MSVDTQYGKPLVIKDDTVHELEPVSLSAAGENAHYNEAWLQNIVFKHPACLPIAEVDSAYSDMVPLCREMNTKAGPVDVVYVTRQGRLVVLEAKLWRNPEARRKVVGQILDYAKEISKWNYEDLQKEVSRISGIKGNSVYAMAKEKYPDLNEASFVDFISSSLRRGEFLLLIVGDGIREDAYSIACFLEEFGNLNFSFGLIELPVYKYEQDKLFIQPRVIAKTTIIKRNVITIKDGRVELEEDEEDKFQEQELTGINLFYNEFWTELLGELELDDVSQPMANVGRGTNIYFTLPPSGGQAWLSTYFSQSKKDVGVYLTFMKGEFGNYAYEKLETDKENINRELGIDVQWVSDGIKHTIICRKNYPVLTDISKRDEIKSFLKDAINRYVNTFRSRLETISEEM